MPKISIQDTFFETWAFFIGIAAGIAFMYSPAPDQLVGLCPYMSTYLWYLVILMPSVCALILGGYLLLSFVLVFIKEQLGVSTKFFIASAAGIPMLLSSIAVSRTSELLLDNGSNEVVRIEIKKLGEYQIPPYGHRLIEVPHAPITIIAVDNDTLTFTPEHPRYLYNYKNLNLYEIQSLKYVSPSKAKTFSFHGPETTTLSIHHEKLFPFVADFLFVAPESINIEGQIKEVEKTVLLRMN